MAQNFFLRCIDYNVDAGEEWDTWIDAILPLFPSGEDSTLPSSPLPLRMYHSLDDGQSGH